MLTLDDAIALALENNLDIEVARYKLPKAQTDFCARKGAARRGAWRDHINPSDLLRQSGRRCGQ